MTAITIGTLGFGEVLPEFATPQARVFTSFLALSGIGIFTTSATMGVRVFLKEDLVAVWRQLRMLDYRAGAEGLGVGLGLLTGAGIDQDLVPGRF